MLRTGSKEVVQRVSDSFAKHPRVLRVKDSVCDKALNFISHGMDFQSDPGGFLRNDRASADMKGLIVFFFGALILIKIMGTTVPQAYVDFNSSTDTGGIMANATPSDKSNIRGGASLVSMLPYVFIVIIVIRALGH